MKPLFDKNELIEFVKKSITNVYNDDLDCIFKGIDDVEIKSINKLENNEYEYEFTIFARAIFKSDYPKDADLDSIEAEYMELSVYVFVDEDGNFEFDEDSLERIN
ncbi:hypothetical protein H6G80_30520 [Nostoc sp. FACHB-87]|uniref:hypothetical protein n=1 Tax=Nostocaceae TaxID=1162 RepID=UPI0016864475|nr:MULTISPECIES: hypothetical protein [Nostocaceae]MBD2458388.1 hypothetical protein [Nostoc sp. FACHB-87]MBD2479517.1 hypothetical protein [Anabaena sp. FACHB-83]